MEIDALTKRVIGCAYTVHNALGPGFLEKVYENALRIELEEAGLAVVQQQAIPVRYREQVVGDYFADLLVEGRLIVELKAVRKVAKEHDVQLVNYLVATGIDDGLLINFGPSVDVKRKFRRYRDPEEGQEEDRIDKIDKIEKGHLVEEGEYVAFWMQITERKTGTEKARITQLSLSSVSENSPVR